MKNPTKFIDKGTQEPTNRVDDKKVLSKIKTSKVEMGPEKGRLKDAFLKDKFK